MDLVLVSKEGQWLDWNPATQPCELPNHCLHRFTGVVLACVNYYPHRPWPGLFHGLLPVNCYSYCAAGIWPPSSGSGKCRHVVRSLSMTHGLRIWEQSLGCFISLGKLSHWKFPEVLEIKFRSRKLNSECSHKTQHSNTLLSALLMTSLFEDTQKVTWINVFMSYSTCQDAKNSDVMMVEQQV